MTSKTDQISDVDRAQIIKEPPPIIHRSFWERYKIPIIVATIIFIIIIIIIAIVLSKSKSSNDNENNDSNEERCSEYSDSSANKVCIKCKEDFDLYKGHCIPFAFTVRYRVDYFYEKIQLYNPNKNGALYAMQTGHGFQDLNPEYNFDDINVGWVNFYLPEKTPISLSYMFANNTKLIDFDFNYKYMDNFYITDMKGMFSGCNS